MSVVNKTPFFPTLHGLHARTTVHAEHLAIDPLAVLRSQEGDNTGDINGETHAVDGRPAGGVLKNGSLAMILYIKMWCKQGRILAKTYLVGLLISEV